MIREMTSPRRSPVPTVGRAVRRLGRTVLGPPAPPAGEVVNLAPNPAFRATGSRRELEVDGATRAVDLFDQPFGAGGLYVHVHDVAFADDIPGRPGVRGARVVGTDDDNDTHVAPGGRNEPGQFRLGMRPGRTYTAAVSVALEAPLTGTLHPLALRVVPGCIVTDAVRWTLARSHPARNEAGDHRISVTFTVPPDAGAAWLRLVSGMSRGHGSVVWHSLCLTETDHPVEYFDGGGGSGPLHRTRWLGAPDASPSVRSRLPLRADDVAPGTSGRQDVAAEAARLATVEPAEAQAFADVLLDRPDPVAWVAAARPAAARGEWPAARALLDRALAAGDPDGAAAAELGRDAVRRRAWDEAARWYRTALDARPDDARRGYGLARGLDRTGHRAEARPVAAEALRHDPDVPAELDAEAMLALDEKAFGARLDVGRFVVEHLPLIRTMASDRLATAPVAALADPVFVYWGQGFDAAPPLVRRCRNLLRATNPDLDVHELTDATVPYYVDVPPDLLEAVGDDRTHRSDLLRLALLECYGGVWLDATCLVTEPLAPHLRAAFAASDAFAFTYAGPLLSSWFLAARRGSYVVRMWRAALWLWWERRGELVDYFLLHHVFELLHHLDDEFRAEWDKGLRLSAYPPHALQEVMLRRYDPHRYTEIVAGSFVHKLRYKYDAADVRPDSYLAHVVRGDLPAPRPQD